MSTYRAFGARLMMLARHSIGRWMGAMFPSTARAGGVKIGAVVKAAKVKIGRVPMPRGLVTRQIWRTASRRAAAPALRAASVALWTQGGLRSARRRTHFVSQRAATLAHAARSGQADADLLLERIRSMFGTGSMGDAEPPGGWPRNLASYDIGEYVALGSNGVVYEAALKRKSPSTQRPLSSAATSQLRGGYNKRTMAGVRRRRYPLVVKMMFNYNEYAPAAQLWHEMEPELVPTVDRRVHELMRWVRPVVRSHPYVAPVQTAFVDEMPLLRGAAELYPEAMPPAVDPRLWAVSPMHTVFLIMKRFRMTLFDFLLLRGTADVRRGRVMAAQLFEAVRYLAEQQVAHRDLKSDNVLVDFDDADHTPRVAVADFGSCLSQRIGGAMRLRYERDDVDLGGNLALMAPEIRTARPGPNVWLDYSKADLWAAGTLAVEIFTGRNPFYSTLRSDTYTRRDMAAHMSLPADVPKAVNTTLAAILRRVPSARPSPAAAADVFSLSLLRVDVADSLACCESAALLMENSTEIEPAKTQTDGLIKWLKSVSGDALTQIVTLYAADSIIGRRLFGPAERLLRTTFMSRVQRHSLAEALTYFVEAIQLPDAYYEVDAQQLLTFMPEYGRV